jgi:hypothetical protein
MPDDKQDQPLSEEEIKEREEAQLGILSQPKQQAAKEHLYTTAHDAEREERRPEDEQGS